MVVDRMDQEEEREHGGDNKEGEEDQAEEEEVGQDKEIRQEEREDDLTAVGLLQEMHLTVIKSPEVEMMEEERLKECEVTQDNETVSEVNDDELVHLLEELRAESTNVDAPNALEVNEGRTENQQKGEVQEVTAQEKGDDHQAKEVQMKDAFDDLKGLRLPPKMKKRGRPKGQECTVVGLPKRKKRQTIPFSRLHPCEKDQAVVSWLVGEELAKRSILRGYMIEEVDVEVRPEKLPSRILDEQVDVNRMRKYFTKDAWSLVQDVVAAKRNDPRWTCPICNLDLDDIDSPTLGCDACLEWFHLKCLGKASQPKAAKWFCSVCRNATHRNSQN
ncbi:transcription initiation factor TFIID subunit 3-like [Lytechinus variegatus]|nr:transcription initiation factor TFIID subunit 3-like [Lytechinus variegatus]